MMRWILATALLLGAGAAASAAPWSVDAAKSSIGFSGIAAGQPFSGTFKRFTAAIDFDPAKPEAGHALITIDTASASTGDAQKDELMPGADFFAASTYPQAVFEATTFKALGDGRFEADGTLTIRNVKKPVALPFGFSQSGTSAQAKGSVQLMRQAFGVGQGAWAADDNVAFAVDVTVDITATR